MNEFEEFSEGLHELKEIVKNLSKKVELLEKIVFSQKECRFEELQSSLRTKPFFVKGHDMPIVITASREPIRGRFLTLKKLYESNKSLLIEDVCKETGRSKSLEVSYLNNLAKDGLIKKERDYINGRERIRYRITEAGKRVIENLM